MEADAAAVGERLDREHDEYCVEEQFRWPELGKRGDHDERGENVESEERAPPANLGQRPDCE